MKVEPIVSPHIEMFRCRRAGDQVQPSVMFEDLDRIHASGTIQADGGEIAQRAHLLVVQSFTQQQRQLWGFKGKCSPGLGRWVGGEAHSFNRPEGADEKGSVRAYCYAR